MTFQSPLPAEGPVEGVLRFGPWDVLIAFPIRLALALLALAALYAFVRFGLRAFDRLADVRFADVHARMCDDPRALGLYFGLRGAGVWVGSAIVVAAVFML